MRVKRFTGDNIADTMSKIKRELGPEAVILQTRQVKEGGFLGFFARTKVEITAALEDKAVPVQMAATLYEPVQGVSADVSADAIKKAYEAFREKENEFTRAELKSDDSNRMDQVPEDEQQLSESESTRSELKQMHTILKEIKEQISQSTETKEKTPHVLSRWEEYLISRGISQEQTAILLHNTKRDLAPELLTDANAVYEKIQNEIARLCVNTETIRPRKSRSLVVALIGPTGVGKTTTIGKLAAGFSIIERRKVALVTADTYRVAAVEQLKTFGEIIGVPVEVVMTPDGLKEAIDRHKDKELVFIDTAGRSPHHEQHMAELEAFLDKVKPDLTLLAMNVTTNLPDQIKAFDRFRKLSTHLILTKLDESCSPGSILDLIVKTNLPVAYLTNGQNVPDDIDAATPEKMVQCVLGEGNPYA